MSEAAQFFESTGARVSLQRMNSAAHLAHEFGVGRALFQTESLFVERLQQLGRGLKEELLQLGLPFIGKQAQTVASIR